MFAVQYVLTWPDLFFFFNMNYFWQYFAKKKENVCISFTVKCPVSDAKHVFSFLTQIDAYIPIYLFLLN